MLKDRWRIIRDSYLTPIVTSLFTAALCLACVFNARYIDDLKQRSSFWAHFGDGFRSGSIPKDGFVQVPSNYYAYDGPGLSALLSEGKAVERRTWLDSDTYTYITKNYVWEIENNLALVIRLRWVLQVALLVSAWLCGFVLLLTSRNRQYVTMGRMLSLATLGTICLSFAAIVWGVAYGFPLSALAEPGVAFELFERVLMVLGPAGACVLVGVGALRRPRVAIAAASALPIESRGQEADTKQCPYCAEEIQANAIKCRFCGERLDNLVSLHEAQKVTAVISAGEGGVASLQRSRSAILNWARNKSHILGALAALFVVVLVSFLVFGISRDAPLGHVTPDTIEALKIGARWDDVLGKFADEEYQTIKPGVIKLSIEYGPFRSLVASKSDDERLKALTFVWDGPADDNYTRQGVHADEILVALLPSMLDEIQPGGIQKAGGMAAICPHSSNCGPENASVIVFGKGLLVFTDRAGWIWERVARSRSLRKVEFPN